MSIGKWVESASVDIMNVTKHLYGPGCWDTVAVMNSSIIVSWKSTKTTLLNVAVAVFLLFVRVDADCFGFCVCVLLVMWWMQNYFQCALHWLQFTGAVQLQWIWWTQLKSKLLFSLVNCITKNRFYPQKMLLVCWFLLVASNNF